MKRASTPRGGSKKKMVLKVALVAFLRFFKVVDDIGLVGFFWRLPKSYKSSGFDCGFWRLKTNGFAMI